MSENKMCVCCGRFEPIENEELCDFCHRFYGIKNNVPSGYINKTFATYIPNDLNRRAYEASKRFYEPDTKGIYLYGNVGSGKSHLSIATLIEGLKRFKYCRYYNVPEILHIKRDDYETQEEAEMKVIEKLVQCKYLFLDDFLAEKLTEKTRAFMYLLFDTILRKGNPKLFITSNASIGSVSELCDDRVASRIVELCGKEGIIQNADKDHRVA